MINFHNDYIIFNYLIIIQYLNIDFIFKVFIIYHINYNIRH